MKQGWEIKKLGEVCDKASSNVSQNQLNNEVGEYPIFGASGLIKNVSFYHQDKPYLSIVKDGSGVGRVTKMDAFTSVIGTLQYILPNDGIDLDYLNYSLMSVDFKKYVAGAAIPHIYFKDYKNEPFLWMPLSEQQQIVSVLDKAFAAISKAKANAEQNLKSAKELFESYLDELFTKIFHTSEKKIISDVAKVTGGYSFKSTDFTTEGKYQVIRMGNVRPGVIRESESPVFIDELDEKALTKALLQLNDVIITQTGTKKKRDYGFTVIIEKENYLLNQRIASIRFSDKYLPKFFLYFSWTNLFKDQYFANETGTVGQGNVGIGAITDAEIPFIPVKEQKQIIDRIDELRIETQKLEAIYQKKISDLEELKKSVLQKAFAGELTLSASTSVAVAKVIPLQKVNGISATDLQAGITALALQKHIEQNQQHSFHHVKAEKIIHLSEYILNIDLERNPVKDAAGPNDFPHAKKVESRAKKAGFYTVYKKGEYYDYQQGRSINSVIQKAQNCLSEKVDTLSQIIDILIPMTTQQAEIVATVYAAWNNLILNGNQFTDEDIVAEARENWHKEKLKIPREKFFNAIEWMRKNELLIPKGNGKTVLTK